MWIQGVSPTNGSRNFAPAIVPAPRFVVLIWSATSLLMYSSYSLNIGSRQVFSPASEAAASSFEQKASLLVMIPKQTSPSAVVTAPVSVATSTMCVAPSSFAQQSASASTRRPSASVLMISIVRPFMAVTTSPGLEAFPPGMFSVQGAMATTLIFGFSFAIAASAATTEAAPVISAFIASMLAAGLMLMPPVSKVIPLPTSARS